MLGTIYHIKVKVFCNCISGVKTSILFRIRIRDVVMSFHNVAKSINHKCFIDFNAWRYMKG